MGNFRLIYREDRKRIASEPNYRAYIVKIVQAKLAAMQILT